MTSDSITEQAARVLYSAIYAHLEWTWDVHASSLEQDKVRGWIEAIAPVLTNEDPATEDEAAEIQYGVRFSDATTIGAESEQEARDHVKRWPDTTLVQRRPPTPWREVSR